MFSPPKILYFPLNKSKDLLDFNVELSIENSEIPEEVKIKTWKYSMRRMEGVSSNQRREECPSK